MPAYLPACLPACLSGGSRGVGACGAIGSYPSGSASASENALELFLQWFGRLVSAAASLCLYAVMRQTITHVTRSRRSRRKQMLEFGLQSNLRRRGGTPLRYRSDLSRGCDRAKIFQKFNAAPQMNYERICFCFWFCTSSANPSREKCEVVPKTSKNNYTCIKLGPNGFRQNF